MNKLPPQSKGILIKDVETKTKSARITFFSKNSRFKLASVEDKNYLNILKDLKKYNN